MSDPVGRSPSEVRARMRPGAHRNAPVVIILCVAVVVFMAVTAWYTQVPRDLEPDGMGDTAAAEPLLATWKDRWGQVAGTPESYTNEARSQIVAGDAIAARASLEKALFLADDDLRAWRMYVDLNLRDPLPGGPDASTLDGLVQALGRFDAAGAASQATMGWQRLAAGDAAGALDQVGVAPGDLSGRWVRLRALQASPGAGDQVGPAADALLELAPGHAESCLAAARAAAARGEAAGALRRLRSCHDAGARDGRLLRLRGDLLDDLGQFAAADEAWVAAGAWVHVAALRLEEGLPGLPDALIELERDGSPPAALLLAWSALAPGGAGAAAARRHADRPQPAGPERDLLAAALLLESGDRPAVLALLAGRDSVEADVLRLRAQADGGGGLSRALGDAWAQRRGNARLLSAGLDLASGVDGAVAEQLVAAAVREDALAVILGLDRRSRVAPWAAIAPAPAAGQSDRVAALRAGLYASDRAEPLLRARLALAPDDAEAMVVLALVLMRADAAAAPGEALRLASEAASRLPGAPGPATVLALAWLQAGDAAAAAKLVADGPGGPGRQLVLAMALEAQGDPDAARETARALVEARPDLSGVGRYLHRLDGGPSDERARPLGGPAGWSALDG